MTHFISGYQKACPARLNYTSNGSGAGISDSCRQNRFRRSDSPLAGQEYAAAKQRCGGADAWNLPVVFGPLAITFNLDTVDVLILDAPTLAKIFNGTITRWDDPAITALNHSMPAEPIQVIYRSDASEPPTTSSNTCRPPAAGPGPRAPARSSLAASAPPRRATRAPRRPSRTPRARSPTTNGRSRWPRTSRPRHQDPASSIVHIGDDLPAKPSPPPRSSVKATTWCSTSRKSTTPLKLGAYPIVLASYEIVCSKYPDAEVGKAVKASCRPPSPPARRISTRSATYRCRRLPIASVHRHQRDELSTRSVGTSAAGRGSWCCAPMVSMSARAYWCWRGRRRSYPRRTANKLNSLQPRRCVAAIGAAKR